VWFEKNKNSLNLKFKPFNISCMGQTRKDFIQASEIHSELLFRHCSCYSDTKGVTVLKKFFRRAQNEFDAKVKKIRIDNGTEFKNTQVEDFLDEEGIKHEFLAPYTPKQNGVAERKNRTLIEMVRTMLDEYKTSDRFWAEAINTACHATNRKLIKKTSYELLTGNKPNVSYF
jgi:transposase InsO family protein